MGSFKAHPAYGYVGPNPFEWATRALSAASNAAAASPLNECCLLAKRLLDDDYLDRTTLPHALLTYALLEAITIRIARRTPSSLDAQIKAAVNSLDPENQKRLTELAANVRFTDVVLVKDGSVNTPRSGNLWTRLKAGRDHLMHGNDLRDWQFEHHLALIVAVLLLVAAPRN